MQTAEFREFYVANEEWLRPYAIFCFLRDLFGTAEHWHWGVLARPTPEVRWRGCQLPSCGRLPVITSRSPSCKPQSLRRAAGPRVCCPALLLAVDSSPMAYNRAHP